MEKERFRKTIFKFGPELAKTIIFDFQVWVQILTIIFHDHLWIAETSVGFEKWSLQLKIVLKIQDRIWVQWLPLNLWLSTLSLNSKILVGIQDRHWDPRSKIVTWILNLKFVCWPPNFLPPRLSWMILEYKFYGYLGI